MLHKLGKSKSLSLAQNYLILSMPLGRSFVFRSFLQNVGLLRVYFRSSGLVFDSHHVHFRCSGPNIHSRCSGPVIHSRCSVPVLKRSHHTHPRYSVPFWMPPSVYRDHHRSTHSYEFENLHWQTQLP